MPGGGLHTPTEFVVFSGITDADGNVGGTTLLCSAIGSASAYPNFDGNQIIITSGDYKGQARDIDGATNGDAAGTITVANAFDGKILEDTLFLIMGIRTVPAEIAALEGKVGAGYDGLDDAVEDSSSVRGHLLLTNEVLARTGTFYFVGIGGNDVNDGKSWTKRRLTVTSGYGLCSSGDTLIIGTGTFTEDINFNTDGVWVIGRGQGHDGTLIIGASTMTCRSNRFEDIFFYNTVGTVVKVGNDVNANYNEFPNCRIGGAGSVIPLRIDGSVAGGGCFNIFDKCNIYEGSTASLTIDGGAATGNIFRKCRIRPQTGVASHGIHVNHASALRNTFIDCVIVGAGSTGTGIYFQAGTHNIAVNCYVNDITTPYNIAANNYIVGCHEDSEITSNNTVQEDFKEIYDKTIFQEQVLVVSVTSAANAVADTVLATVATQGCIIEGVILRADAAQTADLVSCPIKGGTGKILTFINIGNATQANLDATGKQISWNVPHGAYLAVGEDLRMEHNGVGATALDLTVIIVYKAAVDGGVLA